MATRSAAGHAKKALGAYFTPAPIVEQALEQLPPISPRARVVDLACGDGGWLAAAALRWPEAELVGVELDPQVAEQAARRLGSRVTIVCGDGTRAIDRADLVIGNPPWGAGRVGMVRRGQESASRFVDRALAILPPQGRLCLLVPAAWLEVAAHREARRHFLHAAALERVERLGDVFPGVRAPAALVIARREPNRDARQSQQVSTPRGPVVQRTFADDPDAVLNPRLCPSERALVSKMEESGERMSGRVRFILGVVTGDNRRALGAHGEPIVTGTDVQPLRLATPTRHLALPLERVQQAAPRAAYARDKIIYRFVAVHPVAAVDRQGRLTLNSANALAVEDRALDLDFLAAWLNSTPTRWIHRARNAMPRVLRSSLERLPLPRVNSAEARAVARAGLQGNIQEMDELVMNAYRLNDSERAMVLACQPS
jgi:predicted RNA methylase